MNPEINKHIYIEDTWSAVQQLLYLRYLYVTYDVCNRRMQIIQASPKPA